MSESVFSLRVASYNIHKGVQGLGPLKRLEIHNLRQAVGLLQADIVCLQEVRWVHHRLARRWPHWPAADQAQVLCPEGFHSVYRSNAITRHGEHGNAVLSRWPVLHVGHADVSDHRFEQRGLLHVVVDTPVGHVHVIVVHFGLTAATRQRQVQRLRAFVAAHLPPDATLLVAGDFNDWQGQLHGPLARMGLVGPALWPKTFPARLPVWALDRVYARGAEVAAVDVPKGAAWSRWSDHRPLVAQVRLVKAKEERCEELLCNNA